jgi:hypothetical protein
VQHFSHPDAIKVLSIAKTLNISRTHITSMIGCCILPRLKVFIADHSKIANFANFRVLRNVSTFSMKETPVSKTPTYRLSLLLAVGTKSIVSIDGGQISRTLISKHRNYPPECHNLANRGWLAGNRPPSQEEFRSLCAQYAIRVPVMPSDSEGLVSFVRTDNGGGGFDGLLAHLRSEHDSIRRRGQAQFGIIGEAADSNNLIADIAYIMRRHGIEGEMETSDGIFKIVERLCRNTRRSKPPL